MTSTTVAPAYVGLTEAEYQDIVRRLGRVPTRVELQMLGVMWSEHCSYKHSALTLRALPTVGPRLLQGPGENAGVLDIGDGWAVAVKVESHNHPSAVDPFNGAATGVGGIIRDILAMGARPIALVDSLRFGSLEDPKSRRLFSSVVAGIAGYGNCIGVPTVAGEVMVDPSYRDNPLVNVACLGLLRHEDLAHPRASGVGNPVLYVGARTGRDGIGGAAFASEALDERSEREDRASVQMGDPFVGKLLIEATLEALGSGEVVAIQDMGAAGLICAASEMAARGAMGIVLDLDAVPLREDRMAAHEILLSESQERMLLVVRRGAEAHVAAIFHRWGLAAVVVGELTGEPVVRAMAGGAIVAALPTAILTSALQVRPASRRPDRADLQHPVAQLPDVEPPQALLGLLASPDIASKRGVFTQFDHTVQLRTVVPPGAADAAVLRLQEASPKGIALTVDGPGRSCAVDPYRGAQLAVAEAVAAVACVGAEPIGVTDCLNFGNPDDPEDFWAFQEAVIGIADACRALELPVVGGNVSFYNEGPAGPILPTPVVVVVGLLDDVARTCTAAFREPGDLVVLVGGTEPLLDGSQYLRVFQGHAEDRPPAVDFGAHRNTLRLVQTAVSRQWVHSAHDCSDGGLAVALAECVLGQYVGAELTMRLGPSPAVTLFGEVPSRIVLSMPAQVYDDFALRAREENVPITILGRTGGTRLRIADVDAPTHYVVDLAAEVLAAAHAALAEVLE